MSLCKPHHCILFAIKIQCLWMWQKKISYCRWHPLPPHRFGLKIHSKTRKCSCFYSFWTFISSSRSIVKHVTSNAGIKSHLIMHLMFSVSFSFCKTFYIVTIAMYFMCCAHVERVEWNLFSWNDKNNTNSRKAELENDLMNSLYQYVQSLFIRLNWWQCFAYQYEKL